MTVLSLSQCRVNDREVNFSDGARLKFSVFSHWDSVVLGRRDENLSVVRSSAIAEFWRRRNGDRVLLEIVGFIFLKKKIRRYRLFVNFARPCVSSLQRESSAKKLYQMWHAVLSAFIAWLVFMLFYGKLII